MSGSASAGGFEALPVEDDLESVVEPDSASESGGARTGSGDGGETCDDCRAAESDSEATSSLATGTDATPSLPRDDDDEPPESTAGGAE